MKFNDKNNIHLELQNLIGYNYNDNKKSILKYSNINIVIKIIDNIDKILKNKIIDFNDLNINDNLFFKKNKLIWSEKIGILNLEDNNIILEILKKIKKQSILLKNNQHINNTKFDKTISVTEDEKNEFINQHKIKDYSVLRKPIKNFSRLSVYLNIKESSNIFFVFNKDLNRYVKEKNTKIGIKKFKVLSFLGEETFNVVRRVECSEKNNNGNKCGNIVKFTYPETINKIDCCFSLPRPLSSNITKHILKNLNNSEVCVDRILFKYEVQEIDDEDVVLDDVKIILSLIQLNNDVEVNSLYMSAEEENFELAISSKSIIVDNKNRLQEKFIKYTGKDCVDWLECDFKNYQNYFKTQHNFLLKENGKVLIKLMIFVSQLQMLFDVCINTKVMGASGFGKSFQKLILNVLIHRIRDTVSTTERGLMGGATSKQKKSAFGVNYESGSISLYDMIIINEQGKTLNTEIGNSLMKQNKFTIKTIYSFIKELPFEKNESFVRDMRDAKPVLRRGSIYANGNLKDHVHWVQHLNKKIVKEYSLVDNNPKRKAEVQKFLEQNPFITINQLKTFNEKLAKAKARVCVSLIRSGINFLTGLPEAELGRWGILIFVINNSEANIGYIPRTNRRGSSRKWLKIKPRNQEEILDEYRGEYKIKKYKIPSDDLFNEIGNYLEGEYFREPNNIIPINIECNLQLRDQIIDISTYLIHIQKLRNKEYDKLDILTEEEKIILKRWLKYFHNVLTPKMLSEEEEPYMNNIPYNEGLNRIESNIQKNEIQEQIEKQIEKQKDKSRKGIIIDDFTKDEVV